MCKFYWLGPGGVSSIPVYFDNRRGGVIMDSSDLYVETQDSFPNLLELAANNDVEGFERCLDQLTSRIDEVGAWYGRQKGSNQIVLQQRTPLMVAATYGSVDVVKLIVSLPDVDVNRSCGVDKCTALHCAASSGSAYAVDVVKLLLASGADPNIADADGLLPFDVIVVSLKFLEMKNSLQMMLATDTLFEKAHNLGVSIETSNSPPFSPVHGHEFPLFSPSQLAPSPRSARFHDIPMPSAPEKKEYPVDPSLPDIKNGIYSTDEFRMFSFKVRPCSRAYSHDWTECPFVHPGENARRRDPRKYHYSCVPCPDFRKGACRRGDMCEYAHGVFESWLHPAHYRTRLCKDGTSCNRRVCFFAHTQDELRPLYVSTGSAIPSPRSNTSAANAMDFAAAMSLLPGSPSIPMMSPSPFSPPISPSTNGISNTGWSTQHNVPLLHLPGSNIQSSRLRSSLNARDIPTEGSSFFPEVDVQQQQILNELSLLPSPSINTNLLNRSAHSKMPSPSNQDDIFSAENSPRYSDQVFGSTVFSPSHKAASLYQFQQQQQSMLSPIRTNFSPRNMDHSLLKTPIRVPPPGRLSPRSIEPISPMSARTSLLAQREKLHQQFRSLSSRELGSNAAADVASSEDTWLNWGSPNGAPEWSVHAHEFGKIKRSLSSELLDNEEEPDLSWVQSLVKESAHDMNEKSVAGASMSMGENLSNQMEEIDESVLGAWLEQMQLDQLMAQ